MAAFGTAILGRTGLRVAPIGIGASYGVGAAAIEKAYHEHGINFFYWGSMRRRGMGEAVRHLAATDRDRIVVALQTYDRLGFLLETFVARGCRALRIERADILILGYHQKLPSARVVDAARRAKEKGLVRFLAISGHHRPLLGRIASALNAPFDVVMFRYNAAHRGAESEILPFRPAKNPPGTIAYTATRWGQFLDPKKMPAGEAPLRASDCYRFSLSDPRVDMVLCGPSNDRQMEEASSALSLGPLSAEEMSRVRRIGDHLHRKAAA